MSSLKITKKWLLKFGLVLSLIVFITCSAVGSLLVSDNDEAELGAEFDAQLRANSSEYPIMKLNTPEQIALKSYVDSIFKTLLDVVPEKERPTYFNEFSVTIIDKDIVNAFVVPGGYVYIYTGLLKELENESELAGVLGHEIAHVTHHHYRRSIAKQAAISALLTAIAGKEAGELTTYVAGIFNQLAASRFSRDHERESDESGTKYLATSARNPTGIASFFSRMKDNLLANIVGTHPNPSDRVKAVKEQVEDTPAWQPLQTDDKKYTSKYLQVTQFLRN